MLGNGVFLVDCRGTLFPQKEVEVLKMMEIQTRMLHSSNPKVLQAQKIPANTSSKMGVPYTWDLENMLIN